MLNNLKGQKKGEIELDQLGEIVQNAEDCAGLQEKAVAAACLAKVPFERSFFVQPARCVSVCFCCRDGSVMDRVSAGKVEQEVAAREGENNFKKIIKRPGISKIF